MGFLIRAIYMLMVGLVVCVLIVAVVALTEYILSRYIRALRTSDDHDSIYPSERLASLQRDRYICQICGAYPAYTTHHIQPRKQGGPDTRDNLITVCPECHEQIEPPDGNMIRI